MAYVLSLGSPWGILITKGLGSALPRSVLKRPGCEITPQTYETRREAYEVMCELLKSMEIGDRSLQIEEW